VAQPIQFPKVGENNPHRVEVGTWPKRSKIPNLTCIIKDLNKKFTYWDYRLVEHIRREEEFINQ